MNWRAGYRNPHKLPRQIRHLTRKTGRIQGPRTARPVITLRFPLPDTLRAAVSESHRSFGVTVSQDGMVTVCGWSRDHVIRLAGYFFAQVAKEHPAFDRQGTLTDSRRADQAPQLHDLIYAGGHLIVTRAFERPVIVAAAAQCIQG